MSEDELVASLQRRAALWGRSVSVAESRELLFGDVVFRAEPAASIDVARRREAALRAQARECFVGGRRPTERTEALLPPAPVGGDEWDRWWDEWKNAPRGRGR